MVKTKIFSQTSKTKLPELSTEREDMMLIDGKFYHVHDVYPEMIV